MTKIEMKICVTVLLLMAASVNCSEKVPYKTIQAFEGYEEREYPSVKWACTEETYESSRQPSGMFMKLFRYISGGNKGQAKIEMTTPVLSKMTILEDNMINKQKCFYLEQKFQDNPPQPINASVIIGLNKKMRVYVHTFGGYARTDDVWMKVAEDFSEVLANDGKIHTLDLTKFYTAGYDSPFKFQNRTNEVMFLVSENTL